MTIYRYLDRPLTKLDAPNAAIVRAMRLWVAGARSGRCPCGETARALGLTPRDGGLGHFNMLMATLDHESLRNLVFGASGAAGVSDDEAAILALYDAAARSDEGGLRRMAASLVETSGVDTLCTALTLFVASLSLHDRQDRS